MTRFVTFLSFAVFLCSACTGELGAPPLSESDGDADGDCDPEECDAGCTGHGYAFGNCTFGQCVCFTEDVCTNDTCGSECADHGLPGGECDEDGVCECFPESGCDTATCDAGCVDLGYSSGDCNETGGCECIAESLCDAGTCSRDCESLGYPGGSCNASGNCECLPLDEVCGDDECEEGEDCETCPGDCGVCPALCGNEECEEGEDCETCPGDCGACPAVCGNEECEEGEDCETCPGDCGVCPAVCGNEECEPEENTDNCPSDCCPVTDTVYVEPGDSIQAAMDCAQTYARSSTTEWPNHTLRGDHFGRVVIQPGAHDLDAPLLTRAHVRIEAYGAEIFNRSGSHIMRVDDNGGGGYDAPATYWTIVGGVWDSQFTGGGFSIVHTRSFVLWDMEIRDIKRFAHHLEINSSGGEYAPDTYNVVVHNVEMHGVASVHRLADEAINIDYSWDGAAYNTANDGTVTNNVLLEDCEFYDVPRAVASHHFQIEGGAPVAEASGITILGGWIHDIDPSLAESGGVFENDGAIRVYGWQNVHIEGVRFTNCATAISLYAPSDFPDFLGAVGNFVIRNNELESCGLTRSSGETVPQIYSYSANPETTFWDVVVQGNRVTGDWVGGPEYVIATWDTHNCSITGNHFAPTAYSLAEERAHNKYKAQGPSNTGTWELSGNTVSDGSVDNSKER